MFKLIFFFFTSGLISFLIQPRLASAAESICGTLDFQQIKTEQLIGILHLRDLSQDYDGPRGQCSLPMESFPVCSSCENELPETSMQILRPLLGSKPHSRWHATWHKFRDGAKGIDEKKFAKFQKSGHVPPGISRHDFFAAYGQRGHLRGENFFYMHRMMIKMVQFELAMNGKPCVAPWTELPEPDDSLWPLPGLSQEESQKKAHISMWRRLRESLQHFLDDGYLRSVSSLNLLGAQLEPALHQSLHFLYSTSPYCSAEATEQGYCDNLVHAETSPVNKHFWKIHGLVDEIMGRWLELKGYNSIAVDCEEKKDCYTWRATWVGKYPRGE